MDPRVSLVTAIGRGDAAAVTAMLAPYVPGSLPALMALSDGDHIALHRACSRDGAAIVAAILSRYGAPGCSAVLAALASDAYPGPRNRPRCAPLHRAASSGFPAVVEALLAAYGPPGCAPALAALAADDSVALREACGHSRDAAMVAVLLRGYGEPGSPALLEALDATNALRAACISRQTAMVTAVLAAHGEAGCPALIAALADNHHFALHNSSADEDPSIATALLAAYGPAGCEGVLAALANDRYPGPGGRARCTPLQRAIGHNLVALTRVVLAAHGPQGCPAIIAALAADGHSALSRCHSGAMAAALLFALGTRAGAAALVAAMATDERLRSALGPDGGHRRVVDTPWALEAVQSPEAWAHGGRRDAARLLLSPATRAALALPALHAVRSMPPGVAKAMQLFLRDRPWLLYGAVLPGSAPPGDAPPPALVEVEDGDDDDDGGAPGGDEPPALEGGSDTDSWQTDDGM
jgi:hypothetical protein